MNSAYSLFCKRECIGKEHRVYAILLKAECKNISD